MHLYTLVKHTRFYASGLKFAIHALLWTLYRLSNSLMYDSYEIFILNHLVFFEAKLARFATFERIDLI